MGGSHSGMPALLINFSLSLASQHETKPQRCNFEVDGATSGPIRRPGLSQTHLGTTYSRALDV